jgi:hypothetical protein
MHQSQSISAIGLRIIDPKDALGTGIHENQIDLLRNFFIGLLPGDGFKAVSHSFQWTLQPVRIVQIVKIGMSFGTNHSKIAVGFGIPFNLPKPPILDQSKYPTAVTTSIAESWKCGDPCLSHSMSPALKIEKFMA